MPIFTNDLPLSLYVHIPWCVKKCPYCDFNSHAQKGALPETRYIAELMRDLDQRRDLVPDRPLLSIFFGGGTPSLFSASAIADILAGINARLPFDPAIEITLEANPGTIDSVHFKNFRQAGINRLSLGIQSLQDHQLKTLGRIHDRSNAMEAIEIAKAAGFANFNLDLMYGLPQQSVDDALQDLTTALRFEPTHLSWYQLTIEPNTLFYHQRPTLPPDETTYDMQLMGQQLLREHGLLQYEVSAYATHSQRCRHNLNYWEFGDYLGIGAGAHSKITNRTTQTVCRFSEIKHPRDFMDQTKKPSPHFTPISDEDLVFEFMLNALRLTDGVRATLFSERTGLPLDRITPTLTHAKRRGLLEDEADHIRPTELGKRFLNDLVALFLNEAT